MVSIRDSGKFTRVEEGSFGEGQLVVVGDEKGSIQTGYIYPLWTRWIENVPVLSRKHYLFSLFS